MFCVYQEIKLRDLDLHLCHTDSVHPKEDTIDGTGSEDRVEHTLEISRQSLGVEDVPDDPSHAGLVARLLDHLHRVQGMTTHQTCGASDPTR